MTSSSKKAQNAPQPIYDKIQKLKDKQQTSETKMVQQLHRALKSYQGFSLPFPTLMGGFIDVMEQAKTNANQVEAWNTSGEKFLRQRTNQQPQILPTKNSPAISTPSGGVLRNVQPAAISI